MTNQRQLCPRCKKRGRKVRMWRIRNRPELKCPVCGFRMESKHMWRREE